MSKKVKITNIGSEPLAFTGYPMLAPGAELEVSKEEAEILLLNDSVKMVEAETSAKNSKKDASFKGVEA